MMKSETETKRGAEFYHFHFVMAVPGGLKTVASIAAFVIVPALKLVLSCEYGDSNRFFRPPADYIFFHLCIICTIITVCKSMKFVLASDREVAAEVWSDDSKCASRCQTFRTRDLLFPL